MVMLTKRPHCSFSVMQIGAKTKLPCECIDEYAMEASPLLSAFQTIPSLQLGFIVTNYFGMEDTTPQLKMTGNFENRNASVLCEVRNNQSLNRMCTALQISR